MLPSLQCRLKQLFFDQVKLIEYLVSVVIVLSSSPCIWPSPTTIMNYNELFFTPKITAFLHQSKFWWKSNPIPYPE